MVSSESASESEPLGAGAGVGPCAEVEPLVGFGILVLLGGSPPRGQTPSVM